MVRSRSLHDEERSPNYLIMLPKADTKKLRALGSSIFLDVRLPFNKSLETKL